MVKDEAPFLIVLILDDKKSKKTGAVYAFNKVKSNETNFKAKDKIGHIEFIINEKNKVERACIHCTDVTVNDEWQKKGYGRLMMNVLFAYAKELKLPVTLFSLDTAVDFYKKCGFVRDSKEDSAQDLIWYPRKQPKRKKPKKK